MRSRGLPRRGRYPPLDRGGGSAGVFRIEADKLLAFAKAPHAQTTFRPGAG